MIGLTQERRLVVHTLASGSSGNCTLVSDGEVHILIDAGISCRRIVNSLAELGISAQDLRGIFVTHEHTDHICGLQTLTKRFSLPIFTAAPCAEMIAAKAPATMHVLRTIEPEEEICLDSLAVQGFETSHDSAASMGFTVAGERGKMALATDLGMLTSCVREAVAGVDLLIAETNHDRNMLRYGPYPYYLKQRVSGSTGHLCNEDGAELCRHAAFHGVKTVILAHLSAENNTPDCAYQAVAETFAVNGVEDVTIAVAPRDCLSRAFSVGVPVRR